MVPTKNATAKAVEAKADPSAGPEKAEAKPKTSAKADKGADKKGALTGAALAQAVILKKMGTKPDAGTRVTYDFVPSGSTLIDDVIGGSLSIDNKTPVCPGYPRRRLTEVFGDEASGKTTAALQAIAEVQKQGGWALYLDFEHAVDHGYARKIGVSYDPKKLLMYQPQTLEQGFEYMYIAIMAGVDLVIVDSVAAMTPAKEVNAKMDDEAQIGLQARALSRQLPKLTNAWLHDPSAQARNPKGTAVVFINQTRSKITKGGGGDNTNTSGGKALKFYVSLRLKFTRIRSEAVKKKDKFTGKETSAPFGNHTQVRVVKNRMDGKAGHTTDIFIRFGVGIDEFYSLIEAAVVNKIVKKETGGWHTLPNGERFQGREKLRTHLKEHPKAFAEMRAEVLRLVAASGQVTDDDLDEVDQLLQSTMSLDEESDEATPDNPEETEIDDPSGDGDGGD